MSKIKQVNVPEVGAANNKACINELNMSVGNMSSKDYSPAKTTGIKIRGTGAATKGVMARGPMA